MSIQETEKKKCLGKYGELKRCRKCELYKPRSACYVEKWGASEDEDDGDCGMCWC